MRFVLLAAAGAALCGCGYVGDPLPPALNIPVAVDDLRAVQRGDKLILDFTAPALTTEQIALQSISALDIQIGDQLVAALAPEPGAATHLELPAKAWYGKEVEIRVVLAGPKGRSSAASNPAAIHVMEPLQTPADVKADSHPQGVRVSWTEADTRANKFRVTRVPEATAVVDKPEYIDQSVEVGKEYKYSVVALSEGSESLVSEQATVIPKDIFAPATPKGLTAIAGLNTIELAWERSPEPDTKSYRVFRDDQLLISDVEAPAFSDKQVQSGRKYRYSVSAVDQTGNESARSAVVDITAP
jgi:fibronectin type 3 domain-containing protein